MNGIAKLALAASAVVLALTLSGCVAPGNEAAVVRSADATGAAAAPAPTPSNVEPSASATPTHPVDPRDTAYEAEVAAWTDPLPPGFAWPASITGLPAGRWHGKGEWSGYVSAAGIHHCMLVYAAWEAYFVGNDAPASKEYAARADATLPEQPYPTRVTRNDGTIDDHSLASESGICNGFVGDLRP